MKPTTSAPLLVLAPLCVPAMADLTIIEAGDTLADVAFYIDGNLVTPTANTTTLIDTSGTGVGGEFTPDEFFFTSGGNTTNEMWIGGIDDLRIHPSALTEAELDAIFTAMTAESPPIEWPLDEGGGTTTSESKTGSVSDPFGSGIAWSSDTPGAGSSASVSFTGSSGFSTNLDSAATGIDGSGAKTISAWIKTGTTSDAVFFGYSPTNGGTAGADLRLIVNAAGQLRFEANSGNFALSSATVNDNAWHFVALVIPPNATTADVSLYLDGSLSAPGTAGGAATINTATGNEIRIGSDGSAGRRQPRRQPACFHPHPPRRSGIPGRHRDGRVGHGAFFMAGCLADRSGHRIVVRRRLGGGKRQRR